MRAFPKCCEPVGEGASRATTLWDFARWSLVFAGIIGLLPLWLPAVIQRRRGREGWFATCSEALSLLPGKTGIYCRRSFYRMTLDECAIDVHIGFGTTLAHPNVRIDHGVYVGNRCALGMCELSAHVTIGSNVDLLSGRRQHNFDGAIAPVQLQGGTFVPIRIGRNTWIGNSAVVMADVGEAAVIGAGTVVVHAIPAYATAVGNPAIVKSVRAAA